MRIRFQGYLVALVLGASVVAASGCECKGKKSTKSDATESPKTAPATADKPVDDKAEVSASSPAVAVKYLPKQCEIALHVNIGAILSSAPMKKHVVPALKEAQKHATLQNDKEKFQVFLKESGLDPLKDLKEIAVCLVKIEPNKPPKASAVVVGNLKPGLIDTIAKTANKKLVPAEIAGAKGYKDDDATVLQLANGTIVAGNDDALIKATVGASNGFGDTFAKLGTDGMQVVIPETMVKKGLSVDGSPFGLFATKISGPSTVALNVGTGALALRMQTADEKTAIELGGVARTIIGGLPKHVARGPQAMAIAVLSGATVSNDGASLVVTINVPKDNVDALAQMVAANIRRGIGNADVAKKAGQKSTKRSKKKAE